MKEAIDRLAAAIIKLKQQVNRLENMRISPRAYASMYIDSSAIAAVDTTYVLVDIFNTAGDSRRITADIGSTFDFTSTEEMENAYLVTASTTVYPDIDAEIFLLVKKGGVDTHIAGSVVTSSGINASLHISGIIRATSSQPITLYVATDAGAGSDLSFAPLIFNIAKVS